MTRNLWWSDLCVRAASPLHVRQATAFAHGEE